MQDHLGSLESAKAKADQINAANGNRLTLAVVNRVSGVNPMLQYFTDLEEAK